MDVIFGSIRKDDRCDCAAVSLARLRKSQRSSMPPSRLFAANLALGDDDNSRIVNTVRSRHRHRVSRPRNRPLTALQFWFGFLVTST